jgi:hypothetical protein
MESGEKESAIKNYRGSLGLNPENTGGKAKLQKLENAR